MASMEELASALEDTQESLAAALARVEALRSREKNLVQDNARLRTRLRDLGVSEEDVGVTPKKDNTRTVDSPRSGEGQDSGESAGEELDSAGFLNEETQQHPVYIHTSSGKAPATVVMGKESLEFFYRQAHINATEFVGMSSVNTGEKVLGGKGTWLGYIFGKPKGSKTKRKEGIEGLPNVSPIHEDTVHDVPLCPVPNVQPAKNVSTFDMYLERHSWNGAVRKGRSDAPNHIQTAGEGAEGTIPGLWQVLWKDGGGNGKLRKVVFEASIATQQCVRQHIEAWSGAAARGQLEARESLTLSGGSMAVLAMENSLTSMQSGQGSKPSGSEGELVPPKHFIPNGHLPALKPSSIILSEDHIKCLTGVLPRRHRQSEWKLLYSTAKDGFSLQTMYRKAAGISPSILVIRDASDYIFGAYCSESWKTAPRFFGTGETFVFQLEPHRIYYPWKKESKVRNDFFMYGAMESLGVGGTGHFSIWLDGELLCGNSGLSDTFGSPCLSKESDFKILNLELWGIG